MSQVPDFTEAAQWSAKTTSKERWPADLPPEIQLADVEIRMLPPDRELTVCPAVFWEFGATSFANIKVGKRACRSQFYYRGFRLYSTGKTEFDDTADCVVTTLQVHADKNARGREASA